MYVSVVTVNGIAMVFGVARNRENARKMWADTVDSLLRTTFVSHRTADAEFGYTAIFNRDNEIVATVKLEQCQEY